MNTNELRGFTFYLTNNCNLRCSHCWVCGGENADYLQYETIVKRFDEAYELGVKDYLLTGGEPFMHPQIMDVIDYILKKEDTYLSIETNATLIDLHRIRELAKYEKLRMITSIDSSKPETHDMIRGRKGAFNKTIETVKRLLEYNLLEQCIMAVSKINYKDVENTILLCISLGVPYIRVLPVQPCGRGEDMKNNKVVFDVDEQIEFYKQLQKLMKKYSRQICIRTPIPPAFMELERVKYYVNECSFCNRLTLLANGRYSMCGIGEAHEDYQFGETNITSVSECWNKDERLNDVLNKAYDEYKMPCKKCIFVKICRGFCRATAVQNSWDEKNYYRFCEAAYIEGRFPENLLIKQKEVKK